MKDTVGFVIKAQDFGKRNLNLPSPYLNLDAFYKDFEDSQGIWTLSNSIRQLDETVGDSEMTAVSQSYQAAFVFYMSVKRAAAQDIPVGKCKSDEIVIESIKKM